MMTDREHFHSKAVDSTQSGIHRRLLEAVQKHRVSPYRKPYQTHNLQAFLRLNRAIQDNPSRPLILDSGCGTGMSTAYLAEQHPGSLVVGIDRSLARLSKQQGSSQNSLMLRANCEDLWRLCLENRIYFEQHFILYPNPYPKPDQMKRRWHGHPVFPSLKHIAARTTVRSNWRLYLEEFRLAWEYLNGSTEQIKNVDASPPLSLFEKKYAASGQELFELVVYS